MLKDKVINAPFREVKWYLPCKCFGDNDRNAESDKVGSNPDLDYGREVVNTFCGKC